MTDLIPRAAAIKCAIDAVDDWEGGWNPNRETVIRKYFEKLPAVDVVPVQQWISVKDRLPEVAGWYIVFYNESAMQVAFFKGKTWPFNNNYHTITHWMPLPEPPKMDGESDG